SGERRRPVRAVAPLSRALGAGERSIGGNSPEIELLHRSKLRARAARFGLGWSAWASRTLGRGKVDLELA
ncbi:MAG: hypothetical protein ACREFT_06410, partial [Acetobacteraceae bacterium]